MKNVSQIDAESFGFDISRDFAITPRMLKPGPPERTDAMTVGIVTMEHSAPHGGEIHPDGDELLYVISGSIQVTCDSAPGETLVLKAGSGCIVAKGEWHKVDVLEKTQLLHITPGPNGDHRPL